MGYGQGRARGHVRTPCPPRCPPSCAVCDAQLGGRCPYCREQNFRTQPQPEFQLVYLYHNRRIHELVQALPKASTDALVELVDTLVPGTEFADGILAYLHLHGRLEEVLDETEDSKDTIQEYAERHGLVLSVVTDPELLRRYNNALIDAAEEGDLGLVEEMVALGATDYDDAMVEAARGGHRSVVDRMLALGATDYDGAMVDAASEGHRGIVEEMIALGAMYYDDAMAAAAESGHHAIVDRMLALGATDYDDAMVAAAGGGHSAIVDRMVALGATDYERAMVHAAGGRHRAVMDQLRLYMQ